MTQFEELKIMNDSKILYLRKIGKSSKKNELISIILDDETCFSKMKKEEAYKILEDIGIKKEKLEITYSKLLVNDTLQRRSKK